jgi:hypothetical protein
MYRESNNSISTELLIHNTSDLDIFIRDVLMSTVEIKSDFYFRHGGWIVNVSKLLS